MDTNFRLALARLDAEIVDVEARLRDLKYRRDGAQAFLDYMEGDTEERTVANSVAPSDPREDEPDLPTASVDSPTDAVMRVFGRSAGLVLGIDHVFHEVRHGGGHFEREQVRNAIHYATRKGWIEKAGRRGQWVLKDTSAPEATGAEVNEESNSDSSREEGGADDGSALLRGQDEHAVETHEHRDHAGLRASIGGEETD